MGDLTKRLSRREFACKCGKCDRTPVDIALPAALEDCADHFLHASDPLLVKRVVIHINSGYRCADHDRQIKEEIAKRKGRVYQPGSKLSEHLFGWAADFWMEYEYGDGTRAKVSDDAIADYLELMYPSEFGIGRYPGRTHFDVRQDGPARWDNR